MKTIKLTPACKDYLWGGDKLREDFGIESDCRPLAEAWVLSCHPDGPSVVATGPLAGKTLPEYIKEKGPACLGTDCEKFSDFPILGKLIDAKGDLSIQVHPDDELAAKRHNGSKGKTEMWYVVAADKDAHLMSGLTQKITPDEYEQRVNNHTITDVLHDYKVAPGDVFFLPAGRIHSIGSGSFIAEIQQTSDITYRIYDFGRLGLDGKPRELHTELAKAAIDYTVYPDYRTEYRKEKNLENVLVDCSYFTTSLYDLDREVTKDLSGLDSFLVVICIEGKGSLKDAEGNKVTLHQGETVLIPADCKGVAFIPDEGGMKILTSCVR